MDGHTPHHQHNAPPPPPMMQTKHGHNYNSYTVSYVVMYEPEPMPYDGKPSLHDDAYHSHNNNESNQSYVINGDVAIPFPLTPNELKELINELRSDSHLK